MNLWTIVMGSSPQKPPRDRRRRFSPSVLFALAAALAAVVAVSYALRLTAH